MKKKLSSLLLALTLCLSLSVQAFATQTVQENQDDKSKAYEIQSFCVQEVRAFPSYLNASTGSFVFDKSIYRRSVSNDQFNWLELSPATTRLLLNQFSTKGTPATHWRLEITCYSQNLPSVSRYEYGPLKGSGATEIVRTFDGTKTFTFHFPVQEISTRYYNGITGGIYYNAGYGDTSIGLTGALALNSTFSGAI